MSSMRVQQHSDIPKSTPEVLRGLLVIPIHDVTGLEETFMFKDGTYLGVPVEDEYIQVSAKNAMLARKSVAMGSKWETPGLICRTRRDFGKLNRAAAQVGPAAFSALLMDAVSKCSRQVLAATSLKIYFLSSSPPPPHTTTHCLTTASNPLPAPA